MSGYEQGCHKCGGYPGHNTKDRSALYECMSCGVFTCNQHRLISGACPACKSHRLRTVLTQADVKRKKAGGMPDGGAAGKRKGGGSSKPAKGGQQGGIGGADQGANAPGMGSAGGNVPVSDALKAGKSIADMDASTLRKVAEETGIRRISIEDLVHQPRHVPTGTSEARVAEIEVSQVRLNMAAPGDAPGAGAQGVNQPPGLTLNTNQVNLNVTATEAKSPAERGEKAELELNLKPGKATPGDDKVSTVNASVNLADLGDEDRETLLEDLQRMMDEGPAQPSPDTDDEAGAMEATPGDKKDTDTAATDEDADADEEANPLATIDPEAQRDIAEVEQELADLAKIRRQGHADEGGNRLIFMLTEPRPKFTYITDAMFQITQPEKVTGYMRWIEHQKKDKEATFLLGIVNLPVEAVPMDDALWASTLPMNLYLSCGYGPKYAGQKEAGQLTNLHRIVEHNPALIALGPIGFDLHYAAYAKDAQEKLLRDQIRLAQATGLPVLLTARKGIEPLKAVLEDAWTEDALQAVFTDVLDEESLDMCMEYNMFILLRPELTYPENKAILDLVKDIPQDRWLLCTGSELGAPEGLRGQWNDPTKIITTLKLLAKALDKRPEQLAAQCARNLACLVFGESFSEKIEAESNSSRY